MVYSWFLKSVFYIVLSHHCPWLVGGLIIHTHVQPHHIPYVPVPSQKTVIHWMWLFVCLSFNVLQYLLIWWIHFTFEYHLITSFTPCHGIWTCVHYTEGLTSRSLWFTHFGWQPQRQWHHISFFYIYSFFASITTVLRSLINIFIHVIVLSVGCTSVIPIGIKHCPWSHIYTYPCWL